MPDLEIRNIHHLYSGYQIDISAEQAALLRHKLIILQYPMYWFNMPAILKIWFDQVFTYQFAYGSKGNKLKNKKILVSMTVGQQEENFKLENHFLINDFLQTVKKISRICANGLFRLYCFVWCFSCSRDSQRRKDSKNKTA
ncbi:MAG: NAD(P)H-dependent oxidoreductase [Snodgrassella sp.]|uniref:NAD(P)H-dependent oxidoreductase n=1 Tax=Snodgrassella sp. TaxID=2815304 RepID=UPI0025901C5B|nr:NAD(P)H-dependent oxidoreductase [Snodgrassella sp.]MCO6521143.1 NAD(P)H-dependent oxidoreductase [Snodgrassella sp.]